MGFHKQKHDTSEQEVGFDIDGLLHSVCLLRSEMKGNGKGRNDVLQIVLPRMLKSGFEPPNLL